MQREWGVPPEKVGRMSRIVHVWFDVDNTLYRMPPEAEAEIFKRMYQTVGELKRWGETRTHETYDQLYGKKESHSWVFSRLKLPVDRAREVYRSVKMGDYIKRKDEKLISLLNRLDDLELPYSFYTNNFFDAVVETLDTLGVDFRRFVGKITGDSHNKALGNKGYDRVIELSAHEEQKRRRNRHYGFTPKKILYVGDREDLDIKPARAKGMRTMLVVWPDGLNDTECKRQMESVATVADFKCPDVYSLAAIAEQLTRQR